MSRVFDALEKAEREKNQGVSPDSAFIILKGKEDTGKEGSELVYREESDRKVELQPGEKGPVLIPPDNSFSGEEFRKLKTQVFFRFPKPPRSILVTSALPQEGKTTVALNLAITISKEIQKKALLIDGDLRKPNLFLDQHPNSKGLTDYLSDRTPLSDIFFDSKSNGLKVILAGSSTQKPVELIGSNKMKELLNSLYEMANDTYFIIDSPPVLSASEAALFSKIVDGVILVVMAGRTPKVSIQRALKSIDRKKIIGVVLNLKGLKTPQFPSEYGRYYRHYENHEHNGKSVLSKLVKKFTFNP